MTEESGKFALAIEYTAEFGKPDNSVLLFDGTLVVRYMSKEHANEIASKLNCAHEELMAEAVRKAKEEMRERCAKVCDKVNVETGECAELAIYCADAIRSIEVKP